MMKHFVRSGPRRAALVLTSLCLLLSMAACGLDKVEMPDFSGPSGYGHALVVSVDPDVLLADAVSTAVVRATVYGPDGQPLQGQTVFFAVTDENGDYVDLGTLYSTVATFHPPAPQTTEVTGSNGIAQVVYRVPERISVTAIQPVFIVARLVGTDATGQEPKTAQIELRPAEVRRFPDTPNVGPPSCGFTVDPEIGPLGGLYPTNFTVRFRTTSFDEPPGQIVQYFWDFGDGSQSDTPDIDHHWRVPGSYPVTHVVTDNNGAIAPCFTVIDVVNP